MAPEMLSRRGYNKVERVHTDERCECCVITTRLTQTACLGRLQAVDWWSFGTLLYEMLTGNPPFRCRNRKKLYEKIMKEKVRLGDRAGSGCASGWCLHHVRKQVKFPQFLSGDCCKLLKGLLERNVERRLGSGKSTMYQTRGISAIKKHPWFKVPQASVGGAAAAGFPATGSAAAAAGIPRSRHVAAVHDPSGR